MKMKGFDFVRVWAIYFVFFAHITHKQVSSDWFLLVLKSISPGMTMSALGFASGYLLSKKYDMNFDSKFYIKRLSRIFCSLWVCLTFIVLIHIYLGYKPLNRHLIFHYMGLTLFLKMFGVKNMTSIGAGLWFITTILIMYFLLPVQAALYQHKNKRWHLLAVVVLSVVADYVMYGTASAWNVVIAFNIGVYMGLNAGIEWIYKRPFCFYLALTFLLFILCMLATSKVIPYDLRTALFPFYPVTVVPLLVRIGECFRGIARGVILWLSSISYEVYIVHFYFINKSLTKMFPFLDGVLLNLIVSFAIVVPVAFVLSFFSGYLRSKVVRYIVST